MYAFGPKLSKLFDDISIIPVNSYEISIIVSVVAVTNGPGAPIGPVGPIEPTLPLSPFHPLTSRIVPFSTPAAPMDATVLMLEAV